MIKCKCLKCGQLFFISDIDYNLGGERMMCQKCEEIERGNKKKEEERERVEWVLSWIDRMTEKYSGTVYDKNGKTWDWGQALCRECYGENWNNNPQIPESPTRRDIEKAKKWENGELPDWFLNKLKKE